MKMFNKKILITTLVVFGLLGLGISTNVSAAGPAAIDLLSAGNFVVLSKTAITTTGVTAITGDLGISPALSTDMTGFALSLDGSGTFSTSVYVTGSIYAADYSVPTPTTVGTAISAMEAAYTDGAGRAVDVTDAGAGDLAGLTLVPSTYFFSGPGNVIITGDVTLSGSATDVWIFQIPGTLDISANKKVVLTGGALASNVFWVVAGTTTLEPGSTFSGVILAGPGASTIAMQDGATLVGRALGQTDVTFIGNTVSVVAIVSTPTPTPTPAPQPPSGHRSDGSTGDIPGSVPSIVVADSVPNTSVSTSIPTTVYNSTASTQEPIMIYFDTPSFPNAGLSPDGENMPWGQIMIAGLIALIIVSLGILFKRRSVVFGDK
ncbi:MAG: hypothetical protein COV01_00070 [Candidatus Taylorbacteria bacterium CG10_big_fil_rev_8_21_14_0_10_41_48]|uniref:DUF3494 domain-containing protein n=1 Tax=Candidatus Taylorbacteria bacterium CG10_big_fil_rev_8_21_14_0_10_41_48 TaxID=1975024 RepID=A0A2M8LD00_9BACT|nr:MAG: hypothetical protein COV01_00070 [Candidatus Taylorbacteria bacterium CG10_big_fil_rev_8_21_14_0_10_41_48]